MGERKTRIDVQRNRSRLIDAARDVFARNGMLGSLDEIARLAGVGPGTLYRHFPTRDALLEAVYQGEMDHMSRAADELAASLPPLEALEAWMRLFVGYLGQKEIIIGLLNTLPSRSSELYNTSAAQLASAIRRLADRAEKAGRIHVGLDPLELLRAVSAVASRSVSEDWLSNALRLTDILIAGMKVD